MNCIRVLICTLLLAATALAQSASDKLKMAVIVTRHGVRPPIRPDTKYARDPWPSLGQWGVKCGGDLTPRGSEVATLMGAYYSAYFIHQGLLPKSCPSRQVYIWADNEERTRKTSKALAQGLAQRFTGCEVNVDFYNKLKNPKPTDPCESPYETDVFFHSLSSKTLKSRIDPNTMKAFAAAITQQAPGLRERYRAELTQLQKVVLCCKDSTECKLLPCTLLTLPDKVTLDKDNTFNWEGPFSVGSTATENLLLEYANGMDCGNVGWGRVAFDFVQPCNPSAAAHFRSTQAIHSAYFWALNRTKVQDVPYLATIQGSNLANQILLKLQQGVGGAVTAPLVIYGGHDTNIANIAGMLGIEWYLSDLPRNDNAARRRSDL